MATPLNPASKQSDKVLRFGVFDLELQTGELRKKGVKLRIQEQPFQILSILLQRPGELVTREELVKYLWPQGTFVDYDHSLNTAVNKLREVLGDSANTPLFIETLPRRGYRFIAPVAGDEIAQTPDSAGVSPHTAALDVAGHEDELPLVSRGLVRFLFLASQIMYLGFYVAVLANMERVHQLLLPVFSGFANVVGGVVLVTAMAGIPVRFFLITATAFDYRGFRGKYERIFPLLLLLDELWGLSPLLTAPRIGFGLALAVVASLLYLPFGQRTLVRMAYRQSAH